jgi:hypothetical protein
MRFHHLCKGSICCGPRCEHSFSQKRVDIDNHLRLDSLCFRKVSVLSQCPRTSECFDDCSGGEIDIVRHQVTLHGGFAQEEAHRLDMCIF